MSDSLFDMNLVLSMMDDLYQLDEEDLIGEHCTAEMMLRRSSKLVGGLDEIKTSLLTPRQSSKNHDNNEMVENKVLDLDRVIGMLAELMKVDESDVREREFEKFSAAKKEVKIVLDSLKELNDNDWFSTTKTKKQQRGVTFDIGFKLEDVVSMLEALGRSSELDDLDNDTILSAKEMKSRSAVMLYRLPNVLRKLDDFLNATDNDTTAGVVDSVEGHVVVLKRVIGVFEAVQNSPDDEVDFAVYQLYGSFQDIQREAREVLESIYSIQFGEDAPSSYHSSPKSLRKESKGSGNKDHHPDDDDPIDYPSAKDGDSDYKESSRMPQHSIATNHAPSQFDFFDMSMVMSMLMDLGEDEENGGQEVENVDMIHHQSSALVRYHHHFVFAQHITHSTYTTNQYNNQSLYVDPLLTTLYIPNSGLQQVYGELTRSSSAVEGEHLEHDLDPDAKGDIRKSDSDMELDDTLCDLKRVLDLLQELIDCDDIEEAHEVMTLKSNSSFSSIKNEVKGLLSKVASLGNLPKLNNNNNNNHQHHHHDNRMTAADSKHDGHESNNKSNSGKEGK